MVEHARALRTSTRDSSRPRYKMMRGKPLSQVFILPLSLWDSQATAFAAEALSIAVLKPLGNKDDGKCFSADGGLKLSHKMP
eukprot:12421712-Karenia_brevis.AAC.1